MKHVFRSHLLPGLCGTTLALLVGAATADAQSVQLPATARTLGGPGDMNVSCDGTLRAVYQGKGAKVCVTVQNDVTSGCGVTVSLVDVPPSAIPPALVNAGESVTLCASKIVTISTTPDAVGGAATYHWRVDSY